MTSSSLVEEPYAVGCVGVGGRAEICDDGAQVPPDLPVMVDTSVRQTAPRDLGAVPALALLAACGLAVVAVADALSRTGQAHAELFFWVGLVLIFLPTLVRLTSLSPSRSERVTLILMVGIGLYLTKVLRDPFSFTYADELVHQYNVANIQHSHSLFRYNPILKVTPFYPGLEGTTAALSAMTGLSSNVSGLLVIGAARALMMLGLFLLYEAASGSSRLASVAAALYASTPNFLYFSAQFSYESLALPIAVLAAVAGVRWWRSGQQSSGWLVVTVLAAAAVTVTHHLTSYALAAFFAGVWLASLIFRRSHLRRKSVLAALSVAMPTSWLFFVASATVGYLTPVIATAVSAVASTVAHEQSARSIFTSKAGLAAPVWNRVVGLDSAVLILLAQPLGLPLVWRRYRNHPVALVFVAASIAYLASLGLRLVAAAWETGARASEFLFIGGSFVVGMAILHYVDHASVPRMMKPVAWLAGAVVFVGGVLTGTASGVRTAQPYEVAVKGTTIDSPAVTAAQWLGATLHPLGPIAAEQGDARLVLVYADLTVVAGAHPDIQDTLQAPVLHSWQLRLLRRWRVRYIMIDARRASADVSNASFFPSGSVASEQRFPMTAVRKFERAGATRVFDNGDVIIDDLSTVNPSDAPP